MDVLINRPVDATRTILLSTFKVSNDPHFADKLEAIVGLYLNPPEHALVLSVDEKSQIQALDRTQPGLPLKKGRGATMTHDYKRNGTTTLFAALNKHNGEVMGMCMQKHRHQEWLCFLKHIHGVTPRDKQVHIICDNYATHKHPAVQRWVEQNPRFHMHFTPTGSSWLNMVERFFRDLTTNRLKRGIFHDLEELILAVGQYIDRHNLNPKLSSGPQALAIFCKKSPGLARLSIILKRVKHSTSVRITVSKKPGCLRSRLQA